MNKICFNGVFYNENEALFTAANRSFRYGDGLFETMKLLRGKVLLFNLHWERMIGGLKVLQIDADHLGPEEILSKISQLTILNNCTAAARVRLAVYRDEAAKAAYVLEVFPLDEAAFVWNEKGWNMALYTAAQKPTDALANLKSANYLPYIMAGRYATENGFDEALILNAKDAICDGSKTNIFLVRKNEIFTPALHQGCVAGVMRRHILASLREVKIVAHECIVTEEDLLNGDEIFLTNAIQGIRWVSRFDNRSYGYTLIEKLYAQIVAPLYA